MSTPQLVPMIAPDGTPGHVASTEADAAIKAGYRRGAVVTSPKGEDGIVAIEELPSALKAGYIPKSERPSAPQDFSTMRPQDIAQQAMAASGVKGQQQLAPVAPNVNMQQQGGVGAALGAAMNNEVAAAKNEGHFFHVLGGDVAGAAKGGAQAALQAYSSNPLNPLQQLVDNSISSVRKSAANPMDSSADTTGRIMGANVEGIRDAAANQDYTALAAHSVLPVTAALAAYRGVADAGPQDVNPLPSKARAGENFAQVKAAAGDVPVSIDQPGTTALEIDKLAKSGGSMPKVVRDFLKRTTDPEQGPLTYAEARDFYSNATRVSADEFNRLTTPMKMKLGQFTYELGKSIRGAADSVGVGDQYGAAMSEYRNAAQFAKAQKMLKEYGLNALKGVGYGAGAAVGGYGAYEALKK